jgi:hypothetical protein
MRRTAALMTLGARMWLWGYPHLARHVHALRFRLLAVYRRDVNGHSQTPPSGFSLSNRNEMGPQARGYAHGW